MSSPLAPLLDHVHRLAAEAAPDTDAALLSRFASDRDQAAFAALVARHSPMVWTVCRRVLGDAHAAEDAFQATFLILARRAGEVRRPEALNCWLYGVALRVARKARSAAPRRHERQAPGCAPEPRDTGRDPLAELSVRELIDALDEELRRLPERYRAPLLLCCLEGLSQEEAARQLGWTPGSVKGRLERGRKRLHDRLARRGLDLSAALAAVQVSRAVAGKASAVLLAGTARAATGVTLSEAVASAGVAALAQVSGTSSKWKVAAALLGCLATGAALFAMRATVGPPIEARRVGPPGRQPVVTVHERFRLAGFASAVGAVAFSPDGKLLATGSADASGRGEIKLWEVATGKELRILRGPSDPVTCVAFSPDGKTLAATAQESVSFFAGGWDDYPDSATERTTRLWDVTTGRQIAVLRGHRVPATAVAFSPDGKLLATASWDNTIKLWDASTPKELATLRGHTQSVLAVAFSPDGKLLASGAGTSRGSVKLWDVRTRKVRASLTGHEVNVRSVAFSPDGQALATADDRGVVILWHTATGKELGALRGHKGMVTAVAFLHQGRLLATAGMDGTVRLWDRVARKEVASITTGLGCAWSLALSPNGKALAAGGGKALRPGAAKLWDLRGGPPPFSRSRR